MNRRWPLGPALIGLACLAAGTGATLSLYASAAAVLDTVLAERLAAVATTSAALLKGALDDAALAALAQANGLDEASVVTASLQVRADARRRAGRRADLLRVDPARVSAALAGRPWAGPGYQVGSLSVVVAYAPLGDTVLVLEGGELFRGEAPGRLQRARAFGLAASLGVALALALLTARWLGAERARERATQRAARAEGLSRLAAVAAHEIRNPLSIIRATAELATERLRGVATPKDEQAFKDIVGEVNRLQALTDELLELAGERPLLTCALPLGPLLTSVAEQVERGFPGNRVAVEAGAELVVHGDDARLRQVFLNLLANAAQAQGSGAIEVKATARGGLAVVTVRDHGPGVSPEARLHLFEPFFTTRAEGSGLGLAVSRRLVERHGGTLELVESAGRGACFEVALPRGRQER